LTTGRRDRAGVGGFTLIELILVMMLLCTALGAVAPSLRGFFLSRHVHDAAAQMAALAQYARAQAAAEGRAYRLNYDAQAATYWLTAQEGASFAALGTEFGRVFALPEGVAFDVAAVEGAEHMDFSPVGAVTGGRIRLTSRQGERLELSSPSLSESFRVRAAEEGGR